MTDKNPTFDELMANTQNQLQPENLFNMTNDTHKDAMQWSFSGRTDADYVTIYRPDGSVFYRGSMGAEEAEEIVVSFNSHQLLTAEMPEGVSDEAIYDEVIRLRDEVKAKNQDPEIVNINGWIMGATYVKDILLPYIQRLTDELRIANGSDLPELHNCLVDTIENAKKFHQDHTHLIGMEYRKAMLKLSKVEIYDFMDHISQDKIWEWKLALDKSERKNAHLQSENERLKKSVSDHKEALIEAGDFIANSKFSFTGQRLDLSKEITARVSKIVGS